ncbi:pentapeptide repeat-containing protein [Streptomyces longwoodensis]|uniref:pentapeptide repeat-containing protein n=1 Tax=Streptomyces longwoodensis TaxID=68231 RepID=UPI0033F44425
MSTSRPPAWPYCAHGADPAADPIGCRGVHVPGHIACLAHLADADRHVYLTGLTPGANIDHRGTTFNESLFNALLNALRDPVTGHPRLGNAEFRSATFEGDARFESATFQGRARFESATFKGHAGFRYATFESSTRFESATFKGYAGFRYATFKGEAWFGSATFKGPAWFASTTFEGNALFGQAMFMGATGFASANFRNGDFESATFESAAGFGSATFKGLARFESATFKGAAGFESATFKGDALFGSATFVSTNRLGPLTCAGQVVLSGAAFGVPVTLSFAARRLECRRTRWSSTAEIRLRYATVDLAHAVFEYPLTIAAEPDPLILINGRLLLEDLFPSAYDPGVRVASLRGVDAAHLVLADLDLSECLFTGTVHLDQLRLEGACTFDTAPARRWRRWPPVRYTERRVLAEEHHWRAGQPGAVPGWVSGPGRAGPLQLAPVYRALRKAFEDGKHEPGAADFYYGEMEMRRHAHDIPGSERRLLTAYWALPGYGLRASRALAWLGAAMIVTIVLLMAFGLAKDTPKQTATGTIPAGGGKVTFEIGTDDPQNPTSDRFTGKRFEKALNVTLNSVVFRAAGQDLTTAGTYIEMTSRLTEPILLGLAVLAVRNRVKR